MQQIDWDDEYLTVPSNYECPPMCGSLFIEAGRVDGGKCQECPRNDQD